MIRACFRKLDKKTKKLNFNVKFVDIKKKNLPTKTNLEKIGREVKGLYESMEEVSRYIYIQQDIEREHFESNPSLALTPPYSI